MLELRAAVEAQARHAQHGEIYRQCIALLAARVIAGRLVDRDHSTIRESRGVEARGVICGLIER